MTALTVNQLISRLQQVADMGFAEVTVRIEFSDLPIRSVLAREEAHISDTEVTSRTKVVIIS